MKANKNFRMEDEAVSPVIGVILMVAITVVLAAVVFVLVSDLGDTKDSAPPISTDKTGDTLRVISADEEADWNDIAVVHDCGDGNVVVTHGSTSNAPTSGDEAAASSIAVTAGDKIVVDAPSGGCDLTLRHIDTNQLYDTWTFAG